MIIGFLLIAVVAILWHLGKPRPRDAQMSDTWRTDYLYTAGKHERR